MISEDEKQLIVHSMMRAFNKFAEQHYCKLFAGTEKEDYKGAAIIEDHFLRVRAGDINSYMRVLDRRASNKPVMKHRKVLVEAVIRSVAKGSFELPDLGRGQDGSGYTDRQMQRLTRERYGDAFFEPEAGPKPGDGRVKRVSTVFSDNSPPPSLAGDVAHAYINAAGGAIRNLRSDDAQRQMALDSVLRLAFPRFLEDMLAFRDECRAVFESLGESNDRTDYLREQLVDGAGLLNLLYSHLSSILDMAWFRTMPKGERDLLLKPAPEAKYGREDARKAREMLAGIYGRGLAGYLLDICGNAFQQSGKLRAAAFVFVECVSLAEDDMRRGAAWQNLAVIHRINKNFKLALGAMKKALPCLETVGDAYRVCNALQLTGEFQWRLGFRDAAWRSFREVERRGMEMEQSKRWLSRFILGMTFGRLGEMSLRRKYLVAALEMIPEEEPEAILRVNHLIDRERSLSPDDELHPALRTELDAVVSDMYAVLLDKDGSAARTHRGDVESGPARPSRKRNPGGGG